MAAHHNRQRGPLRRGGASQLRAAPSRGRRRGSQLPAPPPALSPERPVSSRASSHRAVGLHRSLAAQHGTFRARVASSAPPRPGRRPPEGEERGKPRRGAQKSARPGGFGAARRNAGHSSRREGRTAAAPPRRPARPRPPTERPLPPLPCPSALLSARKVPPRNARPAEACSPAAIPAAPPGPAGPRTCACRSTPLLRLRLPPRLGFQGTRTPGSDERLAAGEVRGARSRPSPAALLASGGEKRPRASPVCRPNGRKQGSAPKPTAHGVRLRAGHSLGLT